MGIVPARTAEPQSESLKGSLGSLGSLGMAAQPMTGSRLSAMRHEADIRAIADEVGRPLAEIAALYQLELGLLTAHATVLDYLPIFINKKLRRLYAQAA